jgi:hypothetical protein
MIGLAASYAALFLAAALIGFSAGWMLRAFVMGSYLRALREDVERLRRAVGEAHVRRARAL